MFWNIKRVKVVSHKHVLEHICKTDQVFTTGLKIKKLYVCAGVCLCVYACAYMRTHIYVCDVSGMYGMMCMYIRVCIYVCEYIYIPTKYSTS